MREISLDQCLEFIKFINESALEFAENFLEMFREFTKSLTALYGTKDDRKIYKIVLRSQDESKKQLRRKPKRKKPGMVSLNI